jgi:hypothetical protein
MSSDDLNTAWLQAKIRDYGLVGEWQKVKDMGA